MTAAALLTAMAAVGVARGATLAEQVDAALALADQQQRVAALRNESAALRLKANSLTAADPALRLKALSDAVTEDQGAYELEAMVDMPLWLPGQRAARIALAQSVGLRADALSRLLRWEVAGQVREQVWTVALANGRLREADVALEAARALERTVAKRAGAGELARMDLLLARQETMDRTIELEAAQLEQRRAVAVLEQLTGSSALPDPLLEPESPAAAEAALPATHPLLALADTAVDQARAERERTVADRRGNPVLSFGGVRARDDRAVEATDALQLEVNIPFGMKRHAAPAIAAAEREYTDQLTDLHRLRRDAERDLRTAVIARQGAATALETARQGARIAKDALAITRRAFELGETDLTTLLRAEERARLANLNLELTRLELGHAGARLNQALGVVPE